MNKIVDPAERAPWDALLLILKSRTAWASGGLVALVLAVTSAFLGYDAVPVEYKMVGTVVVALVALVAYAGFIYSNKREQALLAGASEQEAGIAALREALAETVALIQEAQGPVMDAVAAALNSRAEPEYDPGDVPF